MFKLIMFVTIAITSCMAKPGVVAPLAYSTGIVAPGVVAAQSSQFFARNHNGLAFAAPAVAAPLAAAPIAAPIAAPLAAPLAYNAYPYARYAGAPLAAPYSALPAVAAPYSALPYAGAISPYAAGYRYPYLF